MQKWVAVVMISCLGLSAPTLLWAGDRANLPLKNWGGFALFRDPVYDDLERLVTAGLADRVVLNTKPLSRKEAARVVARVIEKIRRDEVGAYNARRDLEPILDRLIKEFRTELAALGVKEVGDLGPPPGFVAFIPVDRVQARTGFASRDLFWVNSQGLKFQEGLNAGTTFDSRLQLGDVFTLYVQPEFQANKEFAAAKLLTGYAKLTFHNIELFAGRESLWWGPGLHGSLIFSDNAAPLDHVKIGSAEPFLLPWIGEWVGPTKLLFFLAQLEERRDHPRAKLAGMRATIAPFSFLELGASYANMFDGSDRPRLELKDYPRVLFDPPSSDQVLGRPEFRNNVLLSLDADLRLRNVDRYLPATRDLRLYGEFGWDDTCCDSVVFPLKDAVSWLAGIQLFGVLGVEGLEARFEYAESSRLSFTHAQFYRGHWTRGAVISHVMGTDGKDLYARITNRFTQDFMLGIELNRAVIGNTLNGFTGPKERRNGSGIDVSYRVWERYSVFAQYQIMNTKNRGFRSGDNGLDYLFRVELTGSFR